MAAASVWTVCNSFSHVVCVCVEGSEVNVQELKNIQTVKESCKLCSGTRVTLCFLDFLLSSSSEWWWCLLSRCFFSECRWLVGSSSSSTNRSYLELLTKLWKSPGSWMNTERLAKSNWQKNNNSERQPARTAAVCRVICYNRMWKNRKPINTTRILLFGLQLILQSQFGSAF